VTPSRLFGFLAFAWLVACAPSGQNPTQNQPQNPTQSSTQGSMQRPSDPPTEISPSRVALCAVATSVATPGSGAPVPVWDGMSLARGDSLVFRFTSVQAPHVTLIERDPTGRLRVLFQRALTGNPIEEVRITDAAGAEKVWRPGELEGELNGELNGEYGYLAVVSRAAVEQQPAVLEGLWRAWREARGEAPTASPRRVVAGAQGVAGQIADQVAGQIPAEKGAAPLVATHPDQPPQPGAEQRKQGILAFDGLRVRYGR